MIALKQFIKLFFEIARTELCKLGWVKRLPSVFSLHLYEDMYGTVGLNKSVYSSEGIFEINPVIGVGSYQLEKFVAGLMETNFKPYTTAAIGTSIGYLMHEKEYRAWLLRQEDDYPTLIAEMTTTIDKFCRPVVLRHYGLLDLYDTMQHSGLGVSHQLDFRIPAACALLGKREEAERFLNAKLREMESRTDMAADFYRKFAANLRGFLSQERLQAADKT